MEIDTYVFLRKQSTTGALPKCLDIKMNRKNLPLKLDDYWALKHIVLMIFSKLCFPKDISVMSILLIHLKLCKSHQIILQGPNGLCKNYSDTLSSGMSPTSRVYAAHMLLLRCNSCQQRVQVAGESSSNIAKILYVAVRLKLLSVVQDFRDYEGSLAGLLCLC